MEDSLTIGGKQFQSRLIVGTGKYSSQDLARQALAESEAEIFTVAVRRVTVKNSGPSLLEGLDLAHLTILPNTAGCITAAEAIHTAHLAREIGLSDWVKVEVIGDQATLYPDTHATVEATETLVKDGFTVLAYTSDDIVTAKRLVNAGAAAIMPFGAPIGTGRGVQNEYGLKIIRELITDVPLIVDAGIGTASDAARVMELGFDAVLLNTAIAAAQRPLIMAQAMRDAVRAGRAAFHAGRMPCRLYAQASSPVAGLTR